MSDTLEHECRQGKHCKGRWRDAQKELHGAGIEHRGLCKPCEETAFAAARCLYNDWLDADSALTIKQANGTAQIGGTNAHPTPLNMSAAALAADIEQEVIRWSNAVTGGDPLPKHISECVRQAVINISTRLGTLVDKPARRYKILLPLPFGGDHEGLAEWDGVDAVMRLADLHHRTRKLLGVNETRTWLPDPCPHCGKKTLAADKDQQRVTCRSCRITWDSHQFAWLCNVLESEKGTA